jgi:hypothetical protein
LPFPSGNLSSKGLTLTLQHNCIRFSVSSLASVVSDSDSLYTKKQFFQQHTSACGHHHCSSRQAYLSMRLAKQSSRTNYTCPSSSPTSSSEGHGGGYKGNFSPHQHDERREKPALQALDARTTGEGCPQLKPFEGSSIR